MLKAGIDVELINEKYLSENYGVRNFHGAIQYLHDGVVHPVKLLKKINFVIDFVYWLGSPVMITEIEIENIKLFIQQYGNIVIEKSKVNSGGITRIINDKNSNVAFVKTESIIKLQLPSLGFTMVAQLEETDSDAFVYKLEKSKLVV